MRNANKFAKFLIMPALVMSIAACAMFSGRESAGEYTDDTTITS